MEKDNSICDNLQCLDPGVYLSPKRRRKKGKKKKNKECVGNKSLDCSSSFSKLPSENSYCLPSIRSDTGNAVINTCDVADGVHNSSSSWSPVGSSQNSEPRVNQEQKHSKDNNTVSPVKSLHVYKNEIFSDNSVVRKEKEKKHARERSPINRSFKDSFIAFINNRQNSDVQDLENSSSTSHGTTGVSQTSALQFVGETDEVLVTGGNSFTTKRKRKKKKDIYNSPNRLQEVGCVSTPKRNVERLNKQQKVISVSSENIASPKKLKKIIIIKNNSDYSISTLMKQQKQQQVENSATSCVELEKVTLSPSKRKKIQISDQSVVSPVLYVNSIKRQINGASSSMSENVVAIETKSEISGLKQKKKKEIQQQTDSNAALHIDLKNNLSSSHHKKKRKHIENDSTPSVIDRFVPDSLMFNNSSNVSFKSKCREIDGMSLPISSPVNTRTLEIDPDHTVLKHKRKKEQQTECNSTVGIDLTKHSSVSSPQSKKKKKVKGNNSIASVTFDPEHAVLTPKVKEKMQPQTENNVQEDSKKKRRQNGSDIAIGSVNDTFEYDLFSSDLQFSLMSQTMVSPQVNENSNCYDELLKEAIYDKSEQRNNSKEIFEDLLIVLNHDIPPLHLVDIRPCCAPKNEEKEKLKALGWKQGPFNKSEDLILMTNWERFSKEHNILDPTLLLDMRRNPNNLKREFLQYLGKGLGNRALYQIYQRFQNLGCPRKGLFTKEEDEFILKAVPSTPEPYSALSRVLKRHKHAIYKRYKYLTDSTSDNNENNAEKLRWDINLAEKIIKALMKVLQATSVSQLKDAAISADIWRQVGVESGVPHWKLRQYWGYKLHTQLFADSPVCESKVQEKIVSWLHSKAYPTEKDIEWSESVNLVPGATTWFMWYQFRNLRKMYRAEGFSTLRNFVNALYKNSCIFNDVKPRYLTRYEVNDDLSLSILNGSEK